MVGDMKIRITKMILWFFAGLGCTIIILRILHGPGSVTVLTDILPWGLWKGGGVVALVPIGGAGFTLAMLFYIFHLDRFKPVVRGAVLLGLMCYSSVAFGLSMDIGIWWRIVFPVFHWQLNSVLFEIAWCIMLYLTVLAFEFSHTVLEKLKWERTLRVIEKLTIVLVIFGIGLSTLHQSSLGTLFLATPFRLHPLWHTDFLPLFFFITSMALGCLTISFVTLFIHWLYGGNPPMKAVSGLGRISAYLMLVYLVIRFAEIFAAGEAPLLSVKSWDTANFWIEVILSAALPAVFLFREKYRASSTAMFWVSLTAIIGMSLNRINVAGLATMSLTKSSYFPAWSEWAMTIGILSAAALFYLFCVEYFDLFEGLRKDRAEQHLFSAAFDHTDGRSLYFGSQRLGSVRFNSLIFILGTALSLGLASDDAVFGISPVKTPADKARWVKITKVHQSGNPQTGFVIEDGNDGNLPGAEEANVLLIDGNRDGRYILFDHDKHAEVNGGKTSCLLCHHMNKPLNRATGCYECHSDTYLPASIFDHDLHMEKVGGNDHCTDCHRDLTQPKIRENTTACWECHKSMISEGSRVPVSKHDMNIEASGYMDAMHGLCIDCHREVDISLKQREEHLAQCTNCHRSLPALGEEVWGENR
jgi:Ni/Fe-hydrogenase subunit HybB-like protein